jgi:hypothetical protein
LRTLKGLVSADSPKMLATRTYKEYMMLNPQTGDICNRLCQLRGMSTAASAGTAVN